jgi:hypothetical protein
MEFRVAPLPRILRVCRFASSRFRESCFNGRSDDESRFLELCILWREPADESSCQPVRALSGLTLDARSISLGPSLPEIPFANCRLQLVCTSSCQVRAFKSDSLQGHQSDNLAGLPNHASSVRPRGAHSEFPQSSLPAALPEVNPRVSPLLRSSCRASDASPGRPGCCIFRPCRRWILELPRVSHPSAYWF